MITLDAVRAAAHSADPYDRLDALVRAELAAGRTVGALITDLNPLFDDVLDTPSLPADGRQAFIGTLDRLTGDCDPDQWYTQPHDNSSDKTTAASAPGGAMASALTGRRKAESSRSGIGPTPDVAAFRRKIARIKRQLKGIRLNLPTDPLHDASQPGSTPITSVEPPGAPTYQIVYLVEEKRGVKLLGKRAARQPAKRVYVILHDDLTALTRANIPFMSLGVAFG